MSSLEPDARQTLRQPSQGAPGVRLAVASWTLRWIARVHGLGVTPRGRSRYSAIDRSNALTVHDAQGMTDDAALVMESDGGTRVWESTAMSPGTLAPSTAR